MPELTGTNVRVTVTCAHDHRLRRTLGALWAAGDGGCNRHGVGFEQNKGLIGLGEDAGTDLAFMYIAPSALPSISGDGVFAARDIVEGTVLCEMRGHYLADAQEKPGSLSNRIIKTVHGTLVTSGVCSTINDCRDARAFPGVEGGPGPGTPGRENFCGHTLSWNAVLTTEIGGKPFAMATRNIAKDEEIFFDYGDDFWFWNPV